MILEILLPNSLTLISSTLSDFISTCKGETAIGNGSKLPLVISISISANNLLCKKKFIIMNPGRFTYPKLPNFHGTTFLKQILYELGHYNLMTNKFNSENDDHKNAINELLNFGQRWGTLH